MCIKFSSNVLAESLLFEAVFFLVAPIADMLIAAASPNKINFFMFPPQNFLFFNMIIS